MAKYNCVIFDLDGTILDTIDDLADNVNHALSENGFPQRSLEEVRSFVGNGIRKLVERAVPVNTDDKSIDSVFACFNARYKDHCMDKTKPYDGVLELLAELRARGIKTAVLSNKADYAVQILCEKYFVGLFDSAAGMRDDVPRKPNPQGVYRILEELGAEKEQAVYIGDSEVDVLTASNSGVDCIAVEWGFRDREVLVEAGAKLIASNMNSLLEYIVNEN